MFKKKFKALIAYHYFAHYRGPILRALSKSSRGISWEFASDDKSPLTSLECLNFYDKENQCLTWHRVKNFWIFKFFLFQQGLISLIKDKSTQHVIFLGDMYLLSYWYGALLCKVRGIPVSFWSHGMYGEEKFLKRLLRYAFYSLADNLILYGNRSKRILKDMGMLEDQTFVIYNSLDFENQNLIFQKIVLEGKNKVSLFTDPHRKCVGFVGRLTEVKRLDMLIKSVKKLEEKGLYLNVLLIGEGPSKGKLEKLVEELGCKSQFVFYGACHDEAILGPLIYSMDLVISPGNVGLTAMHAMAYGTPVATHNKFARQMPEYEAIIDGETGFFFEHADVDSLTNKMLDWFARQKDRTVLREKCRRVIEERYNPSYQAQLINSISETMIRNNEGFVI